ncbi:MAG: hypothetical protein IK078_01110, partial [Lachnospiraceae bacterium]|nr:hypothetical protein [Lachnospiraceae bacterium]
MYKKSKLMRALAFTMAAALSLTGLPMTNALAAPEGANIKKPAGPAYETVYEDEGYSLVWHDEFDGTSLNLEDWNVESHEPGWANSELQRYVSEADMEDNIKVSENNLVITPTAEKKPVVSANDTGVNILKGEGFDNKWAAYADAAATGSSCTLADGKVTVTVANPGTQGWHIHAKQENITLTKDHKYSFKMKATTTGDV